jgi:hypothetical protein
MRLFIFIKRVTDALYKKWPWQVQIFLFFLNFSLLKEFHFTYKNVIRYAI